MMATASVQGESGWVTENEGGKRRERARGWACQRVASDGDGEEKETAENETTEGHAHPQEGWASEREGVGVLACMRTLENGEVGG